MTKFIFADTETTGLDKKVERILEAAFVQVIDRKTTGKVLHQYINPEKEVQEAAYRVHGISWQSVKDKPLFPEVAEEIIAMLEGHVFVAHNAPFDVGFINMEFERAGHSFRIGKDIEVLDTLKMAKEIFPGQKNNLDALCNRLSIDKSNRVLHGALLDTELLVQVYIAMTQKQEGFSLARSQAKAGDVKVDYQVCDVSAEEVLAHDAYMEEIR